MTAFTLNLFVFTGCAASYTPPPLTMEHPAHPEAAAVPAVQPSTTLAYRPSDIPQLQAAAASIAQHPMPGMRHGEHGARPDSEPGRQGVVGEGKVVAIVPGSSQLVVDHQEIKGFMEAMTMGYRVDPASLLEGVQAGDKIRFTIDTRQNAIIEIEKLKE